MKNIIILASIVFASTSLAEDKAPKELQDLLAKRENAMKKLDADFDRALEKLKARYMKRGDLDAANAVAALMKDPERGRGQMAKDKLTGTSWDFLGIKKQRINGFRFLMDGRVKCDKAYREATWVRLDENVILFRYAPGSSYIVFHQDGTSMKGYHSSGGRVRYLTKN